MRRKKKKRRYDFLNKEWIRESDDDDDLDYYDSDYDNICSEDEIEVEPE